MSSRLKAVIASVTGITLLAAVSLLALRPFGTAALMAGLVACGLGMRHAFDADHIAAIDNVTRRLRQDGQRPVAVGFFFSLGHSTIVLLLVLGLAVAFGRMHAVLNGFTEWGLLISTVFSALILTTIGLTNLAVLRQLVGKIFGSRTHTSGEPLPSIRFARPWLRRAWSAIDSSWKMYPAGMLFGLGFDTATEVALLAISVGAVQSGQFPIWAVMIFPLLFTAGMCLMDTSQSLLMLRMYDWAIRDADRSLKLNTCITGISVLFALGVAGIRWADLAHLHTENLNLSGSSALGLIVSSVMLVVWLISVYYRQHHHLPQADA